MKSLIILLAPFFGSFFLIGLAELGDKTQLLTLTLATRHRPLKVFAAVFLATALLQLIAVSLGQFASVLLPLVALKKAAGILFIIFGLWIILGKNDERASIKTGSASFLAVFGLFFLAELGDKTQLATVALATKYNAFYQVWLGATAGMAAANGFGIIIGNRLGKKIPQEWLRIFGGVIFILFGLVSLFGID